MSKLKESRANWVVVFEHERLISVDHHKYLTVRRDSLVDKIRFGLIALNAASLAALLTLLGTRMSLTEAPKLAAFVTVTSACAFAVGLVAGGLAVLIEHLAIDREAVDASARANLAATIIASFEIEENPDSIQNTSRMIDDYMKLPAVGFRPSFWALRLQMASASAWICGIMPPIVVLVKKLVN